MTVASGPDVIDASALLALLQDEPGADGALLADAVMSSVNFSEVLHKSVEKGASIGLASPWPSNAVAPP